MNNPHIGPSFDEFIEDMRDSDPAFCEAIDALAAEAVEEYERGETMSLRDYFHEVFPHIEGNLRYLVRKSDE